VIAVGWIVLGLVLSAAVALFIGACIRVGKR
jgi:hypothetical protein